MQILQASWKLAQMVQIREMFSWYLLSVLVRTIQIL